MDAVFESRKAAYQAFLLTPFWRELSLRKKMSVNFRCERCRRRQNLNSHHKFYRPDWFETKIEDLICLCRHCHEVEHGLANPLPVVKIVHRPNRTKRKKKGFQSITPWIKGKKSKRQLNKEKWRRRKKKEDKMLAIFRKYGSPGEASRPFVPGMYEGLTKQEAWSQIGRRK